MNALPVDVLLLITLDMETEDVISWCQTNSRFRDIICNNPNFWRNKLFRNYGFSVKSSDLNLLKDYDRLLYQAYTLGRYILVHREVITKGYQDLLDYMNNMKVWGLVSSDGSFRIGALREARAIDERTWVTRRKCLTYKKSELITIITDLTDTKNNDLTKVNNIQLCDLIRSTLETKNNVFHDERKSPIMFRFNNF